MGVHIKQKGDKDRNYLTGPQRRFVVRALARWNSPTEVVRMIEREYGVTMSRQAISKYDPTLDAGRSLAPALKNLFHRTRRDFVENIEQLPLAHRSVRLDQLKLLYDEARDAGNAKLAVRILGEAGKEMKPMDYTPDDPEDPDDEQDED